MSDSTNVRIEARGVPKDLRERVRAVMEEHVYNVHHEEFWDEDDFPDAATIAGEGRVGATDDIETAFQALRDEFGDFAYAVFEDPKYEFDGSATYHVPAVGDFTGNANADGEVYLLDSEVHDILDAGRALLVSDVKSAALHHIIDELERLTGRKVIEAFDTSYSSGETP